MVYKAENNNIFLVTNNLSRAPKKTDLNENSFFLLQDKVLHICFFNDYINTPSLTLKNDLEKSYEDFKRIRFPFDLKYIVSIFSSVFFVTIFLLLFAANGDAIYELLDSILDPSNPLTVYEKQIVIGLFLISFVALLVLPNITVQLIQNIRNAIRDNYHNSDYYYKTYKKFFRKYNQDFFITNIVLWNPANQGYEENQNWETIIKALMDSIQTSNIKLYFCIHEDEKYKVELQLDKFSKTKYIPIDEDINFLNFTTHHEVPKEYLSKTEEQLLELMLFCSTLNVQKIVGQNKINGYKVESEHICSIEFVQYITEKFPERFPKLSEFIDGVPLFVFFRRCINDYKLFTSYDEVSFKLFIINSKSELLMQLSKTLRTNFPFVKDLCINQSLQITENIKDPVTALIVNVMVTYENEKITLDSKLKVGLLKSYIEAASYYEHYFLFKDFWFLIFKTNEHEINTSLSLSYTVFDVRSLELLSDGFEKAGEYDSAEIVNDMLSKLIPTTYLVKQARLKERRGNHQDAIDQLSLILQDRDEPSNHNISYCLKLTNFSFSEQIEYYLEFSWIIVSGRLTQYKTSGIKYLNKIKTILESTINTNMPKRNIYLRRYYNLAAQYCEWDFDYEKAIKLYEKCLFIPGISKRFRSGTIVNMGIAYRFLYKQTINEEDINNAIKMGKLSSQQKESLGDKDELPIALHNLALSRIYKYCFVKEVDLIKKSYNETKKALDILEEIHAHKKKLITLFEFYLSGYILYEFNAEIKELDKNRVILEGDKLIESLQNPIITDNDIDYISIEFLLKSLYSDNVISKQGLISWVLKKQKCLKVYCK